MKQCIVNNCKNEVQALGLCTTHYFRQRRHGSTDKPKRTREKLLEEGKSYCPKCHQTKFIDDFHKDKTTAFGISIYCNECNSKKGKQRYRQYKWKNQDYRLRKTFGLTLDQYNELLRKQNGRCAICGKTPSENKIMLAVDHDHKTNKIRGILCTSCNNGVGRFSDNAEYLMRAAEYLRSA